MKRQFMFGTMLSAVLVAGTAAQQPGQTAQSGQGDRQQTITLTGCLQPVPKAGAATSGTTGDTTSRQQANRDEEYILTNAAISSSGGKSGTGSGTGTSGTASGTGTSGSGSTSRATTYKVVASDSQDLDKLVNSRVEVTGTLLSGDRGSSGTAGSGTRTGSATGSGTGTGSGAAATGQGERANMPTVRVTSVRQLSGSCTGGDNH